MIPSLAFPSGLCLEGALTVCSINQQLKHPTVLKHWGLAMILADLIATQAKHNGAISNSIVDAAKRLDELTPCLHAWRRFLK
jgi:hypothetical protein